MIDENKMTDENREELVNKVDECFNRLVRPVLEYEATILQYYHENHDNHRFPACEFILKKPDNIQIGRVIFMDSVKFHIYWDNEDEDEDREQEEEEERRMDAAEDAMQYETRLQENYEYDW